MKRKKEGEEWYGKISYQDHEEELDDPADVEKKIREGAVNGKLEHLCQKLSTDGASYWFFEGFCVQHFIFCKHHTPRSLSPAQDEMAGVGVGISDDLISLEIASPDVPDLTLIDLPGIARVAVKGQPENIGEQVWLFRVHKTVNSLHRDTFFGRWWRFSVIQVMLHLGDRRQQDLFSVLKTFHLSSKRFLQF